MDVRRLLIFRTVARSGSLGAAARELGWSQPAVSQHIRALERDARLALVVRGPRGISLTGAGAVLLVHADAIAARLASADDELAALADLRRGTVRVAAFPSACATVVPAALAQLSSRHPALRLEITEAEPPEAAALVESGEVDAALVFDYGDTPDSKSTHLRRRILGTETISAVLPRTDLPPGDAPLTLGRLCGEQWIAGCPVCRAHLLTVCSLAGFVPDIRHSTDDYVVVQSLVARGLGVALLPALALRSYQDAEVVAVPLVEAGSRRLFVVQHSESERSPSLIAFEAVLDTALGEVGIRHAGADWAAGAVHR